MKRSFESFGELIAELLKLATVLIFGATRAPSLLQRLLFWHYFFVLLAVFAVRPAAIWLPLVRGGMHRHEVLTVGWFGPKGFASVVYGLLILAAGMHQAAHLIALAVTASILMYSSTDILVGRWFQRKHLKDARRDPVKPVPPAG